MQRLVDTLADLLKNGGDRDPEIIEHVCSKILLIFHKIDSRRHYSI